MNDMQRKHYELAEIMMRITRIEEQMFNTVLAKDQVNHLLCYYCHFQLPCHFLNHFDTPNQPISLILMLHLFQMQIYGEVSRSFAVRWKDQLERHWHLVDKHGNMHDVVYNKDLVSPTIVHGWTTIRTFYGFEGDHHVTLTYYGQCLFLLTIFKTSNDAKTFPK